MTRRSCSEARNFSLNCEARFYWTNGAIRCTESLFVISTGSLPSRLFRETNRSSVWPESGTYEAVPLSLWACHPGALTRQQGSSSSYRCPGELIDDFQPFRSLNRLRTVQASKLHTDRELPALRSRDRVLLT